MFRKFKLLKFLDLQGKQIYIPLNCFPKEINTFVPLRCVNLRQTNIKTVPRYIEVLALLEILDLKYTLVKELPAYIYKLKKLSHLLVSFRGMEEYHPSAEAHGMKVDVGVGALSKFLHKVSLINVRNHKGFIEELGNLMQLRKLGLANLKREFRAQVFRSIQKMKNLVMLDVRARAEEYLELETGMENPLEHIQLLCLGRLQSFPTRISSRSLPSLVKVVLKGSKQNAHQSKLETLGGLRSLMELKLAELVEYHTGERLVLKAQTFKSLKKLHVEKFEQLDEVTVEKGALAMLEDLTDCHCKKLKPLQVRCSLGGLEELLVHEMSDDFISEIERRISKGELVDHVQPFEHSSSTSGRGNIGLIHSRRFYS